MWYHFAIFHNPNLPLSCQVVHQFKDDSKLVTTDRLGRKSCCDEGINPFFKLNSVISGHYFFHEFVDLTSKTSMFSRPIILMFAVIL